MRLLSLLIFACVSFSLAKIGNAAIYYVDGASTSAADTNPGTAARPWKTISRAAGAAELKPGDTVLIQSGVYREAANITVSGAPGKPLTFAAAPGAEVVIKGSKIVTGDWTQITGDPAVKEPYPNAFSNVWKIHLDDSYFQGLSADGHYISDVFLGDNVSLQKIGPDEIYTDPNALSPIGRDLNNIYQNAFYFDKETQDLYIDLDGRPEWYCIEVGTIPYPFQANNIHDVNIRGLQVRQNRQPSHQWALSQVGDSERVNLSDCSFTFSDFGGFSFGTCKSCTIKNSAMSYNGNTGFGFYMCMDCLVDHCQIIGNNTRRFSASWHAGGAKSIPGNLRCTIENCVVADNIASPGIWFDTDNADCRIIHNVVYHNDTGVMYEISPGGATITDNLIFSNKGSGILISGSKGVIIVNNTVSNNDNGIILMPRGDGAGAYTIENNLVQNNLLLRNYTAAQAFRGCDLTLFLGLDASGKRTVLDNHSRSNLYATGLGMPVITPNWNGGIALADWQQKYGEDKGSRATNFLFAVTSDTFQLTDPQASSKRAIATPLPAGLAWKPVNPKLVGSSLTVWPASILK